MPRLPILLALTFLCAAACVAQSTNATITGRVLDLNGAVILGAKVDVISVERNTHYATETNREGIYSVSNLIPGGYKVEVSKPGFKTLIKPDIVLHVQDVAAINFTLPVGSTLESITVEGGAPLVNTESAAIGNVVDPRTIAAMPVNGRDLTRLTLLDCVRLREISVARGLGG